MPVRLTDPYIRGLDAPADRTDIRDAIVSGLVLRLTPFGARTFAVWYRVNGRPARITLGKYRSEDSSTDGITLAQARARARDVIQAARLGHDPQAEKREAREADTIADLVADFLEEGKSLRRKTPWRPKTREEFERLLRVEILPTFGSKRAVEITKADVAALINRLARRAPTVANRTLQVLKLLYTWAMKNDRTQVMPAWPDAPSPTVHRERVLTPDELRAVWAALDSEPALITTAFKMMMLTAQRRGEVLSMRWRDLAEEPDGWWWTIPAESNKSARLHRVPLAAPAVALLDGLRPLTGGGAWVFPSPHAGKGPIANPQKAAERLWKRAGVTGARLHDFRRTAASGMAASGVARVVIGKVLNHADGAVTAIYDRHGYDTEKRAALEAWAKRLEVTLATTRHAGARLERAKASVVR